jgi:release factor glutamine methyltransferase
MFVILHWAKKTSLQDYFSGWLKKYSRTTLLDIRTSLTWSVYNQETMSTIVDLKLRFREVLGGQYPPREIDQFFTMTVEEFLGYSKAEIHINVNEIIQEAELEKIAEVLNGLRLNEPIQYLLGYTEFYGLKFKVNPHVLIPRPETEELIRWITEDSKEPYQSILDLGTGSGCIAISLKKEIPHANVYAVDKSIRALNLAKKNAELNDVGVEFFAFDILKQEGLAFMSFDLMVSNPPYVTLEDKEKMARNVVDFEPHLALFVPEDDPLIFYRRIVDLADGHLNKGGKIYFEINESFAVEIRSLLMDRGFTSVEIRKDLNGRFRMAKGIKN